MKRMHDTNGLVELFVKTGLIAAIAATMLLPTTIRATGSETTVRPQPPQEIPLATIPNLKTIPWLTLDRAAKGPRIDTLLVPRPFSAFASGARLPAWRNSGAPGVAHNGEG